MQNRFRTQKKIRAATRIAFAAVLAALGLSACSGGGGGGGGSGSTTYVGAVVGTSESGSLTVTVATATPAAPAPSSGFMLAPGDVNATGSYKPQGGTNVALTGTYNTTSKVFTVSGGGSTFTGTLMEGTVNGTFTGTNGYGVFSANLSVNNNVSVFCGTWTSTAGQGSGTWNVVVTAGSSVTIVGLLPGGYGLATGTVSGNTIDVLFKNAFHSGIAGNTLSINGTISGTTVSGTYSIVHPGATAGDHGTFTGSACQ